MTCFIWFYDLPWLAKRPIRFFFEQSTLPGVINYVSRCFTLMHNISTSKIICCKGLFSVDWCCCGNPTKRLGTQRGMANWPLELWILIVSCTHAFYKAHYERKENERRSREWPTKNPWVLQLLEAELEWYCRLRSFARGNIKVPICMPIL